MKLLGWMHKKFWPSGSEPIKDFAMANACICLSVQTAVDDEEIYLKPSFGSIKSSSELETNNELETSENISASSDFFHGFLTIGTLGSEPATPTFSMAFENMIEMPNEVTEDDLKMINYELEKFLGTETKEDWCVESLETASQASIITLAAKHVEGTEDEKDGKTLTCPLQGYLFGSTVELPDKMMDLTKEKTSSLEPSHRTMTTNENSKENTEERKIHDKHSNNSALSFVKKMLKKLRASSHGSGGNNAGDSYSTKKKVQKVLRMFHRKIHPESFATANEYQNSQKSKMENVSSDHTCNVGHVMNQAEEKITSDQKFLTDKEIHYCQTNLGLNCKQSANKGHWIKTDADYLVLEL